MPKPMYPRIAEIMAQLAKAKELANSRSRAGLPPLVFIDPIYPSSYRLPDAATLKAIQEMRDISEAYKIRCGTHGCNESAASRGFYTKRCELHSFLNTLAYKIKHYYNEES